MFGLTWPVICVCQLACCASVYTAFLLIRDINQKSALQITPIHLVLRDFCTLSAVFTIFHNVVIVIFELVAVPQNVALAVHLAGRVCVLTILLNWCAGGYLRHCYVFHWTWVTEASDEQQVRA